MRRMRVAAFGLMIAAAVGLAAPASAGWMSRLLGEAAETGGGAALKAGRLGLGALDSAAAHVAALPRLSKSTALAAHVTPEGHWKFMNRDGEVFTAATPEELARAVPALAPERAAGDRLALYLSEDTVFTRRRTLKDLPADADLHVVVGRDAYRLRRPDAGAGLAAEVRPGVLLTLGERALFEEAVYRLARPLNRSSIRVLALESGGPARLSAAPRFDPATKAALVDEVDPAALPAALASLKGQTAVVSGRVDGLTLAFRGADGGERTLDVARLVQAAEEADVNLVLIATGAAHQPGGRNWLWQKVAVAGLDEALGRATFGDFLSALGGAGGDLAVTAAPSAMGRVVLSALPVEKAGAVPLSGTLSEWIGDLTGDMAVRSVEVFARDAAGERELDARILPGIPSALQYAYLGALVAGLLAWPVSRAWWARLWPPEDRREYAGRLGYAAARAARLAAFLLVFLPLAGLPALIWTGVLQLWGVLSAPFRALSWLRARLQPPRA